MSDPAHPPAGGDKKGGVGKIIAFIFAFGLFALVFAWGCDQLFGSKRSIEWFIEIFMRLALFGAIIGLGVMAVKKAGGGGGGGGAH